ncbi:hypothetical protein D3C72_2004480 [compost metagenome]
MRASRIFALARTMRWAMVEGLLMKARAISSVFRSQTSRKVRGTWASAGNAGWQQVKISRRRSSSTSSPSSKALAASSSSATRWRLEASKRARRRRLSMALKRPADTSQARGLAGMPSRGHCCTAAMKASCRASSARSKSPSRRIRVASTRRESLR